jgi:hypothetical protein
MEGWSRPGRSVSMVPSKVGRAVIAVMFALAQR